MHEEEPVRPRAHTLGTDLSRLSVCELDALRHACLAEAERITAEINRKGATKAAADSVFRL